MSELSDRYRRRARAFERLIAAVRPDQWANPSPCEEWTACDVVDHVVSMHRAMFRPLGRKPSSTTSVARDPLGAFKSAVADVEETLDDRQLASAVADMPAGRMSAEQYIDTVLSDDLPLHGWDLATATGQDDAMDQEDVELIWATVSAIPKGVLRQYRAPEVGIFGPEVELPEDAPLQDRLLGLIGRKR
jgi:uncharacterized protein (TIGR03086 family)